MMHLNVNVWRRLLLPAALILLIGCSNRYSVHGRVTYEDGSPLTEGQVVGEMTEGEEKFMAQGSVASDGTFSWGTQKPGDGAKPGKYRVVVLPRAVGEHEAAQGMQSAVDPKFSDSEKSGIDFEVKPGDNELKITVTKPKEEDHEALER